MGLRLSGNSGEGCFFITTTFINHRPLGQIAGMYEALEESIVFYCSKYNAGIIGYVLMPTHIHLLIQIDGRLLSGYMRDFKKYISQKAAKNLGIRDSTIWMPRYHKAVIFNRNLLRAKLTYMHNNPVKTGLATVPQEWNYSSAKEYLGVGHGSIPIIKEWF